MNCDGGDQAAIVTSTNVNIWVFRGLEEFHGGGPSASFEVVTVERQSDL